MFSLLVLCVVFYVGISIEKTDIEPDGYSGAVKAVFEELTEYPTQVLIAKEKMNEFRNETWDRKYAIAMINLYTQPGQFYITLDAEMKNDYPATNNVWRRAGILINRGIDILEPKTFEHVFKGCQTYDDRPIPGQEYYFKHIITASQSKDTAVKYINCAERFLFKIEHVLGVSVEKYSHYPQDKEIIMKSTHNFNVVDVPYRDGQYDIYFLSEQANESVSDGNTNDAISTTYGSPSLIKFVISFFALL